MICLHGIIFAVLIKFSISIVFTKVVILLFNNNIQLWNSLFLIGGLGSLVFGCFGSLKQIKIKRFIAYSSVNQMGFFVLALSLNSFETFIFALLFIYVYLTTILILCSVLLNTFHILSNKHLIYLSNFKNLSKNNVVISLLLLFLFFSSAGIPPTPGFFTKFIVLFNLFKKKYLLILFIIFNNFYG